LSEQSTFSKTRLVEEQSVIEDLIKRAKKKRKIQNFISFFIWVLVIDQFLANSSLFEIWYQKNISGFITGFEIS
jgi:hypothetical protein